jgi:hypothetical protein
MAVAVPKLMPAPSDAPMDTAVSSCELGALWKLAGQEGRNRLMHRIFEYLPVRDRKVVDRQAWPGIIARLASAWPKRRDSFTR